MQNRFLLTLLILMFTFLQKTTEKERNWILAADLSEPLPFWDSQMPNSGSEVSWTLREVQNQTILKISLTPQKESKNFLQIKIYLNSSLLFEKDLYQSKSSVQFIFYSEKHIKKRWLSQPNSLELTVNNGKVTISQLDFYLWISLSEKLSINYYLILTFLGLMLIRTEVNFGVKNRIAVLQMMAPALFMFYCLFWKGISYSLEEIIFESPWKYAKQVGYVLFSYIYIPKALIILERSKSLLSFLQLKWKVILEYLLSIILCYFIFIEVRLEAIFIYSFLQIFLLFAEQQKPLSFADISLYFADIIGYISLNFITLHPQQHQLTPNMNILIGCLCCLQVWAACRKRKEEQKGRKKKK